jgi:salicylate hydroxylase
MEQDHGAPYYHIHRADFHRLLFDLVQDTENVTLRLASTVTALSPVPNQTDKVSVTLQVGNNIML